MHKTDGPTVAVGQHSEAGRKPRNEDSYGVIIPSGPLLRTKGIAMAIADGVSASEAAKEASETCVKSFLDDYYGTHESWPVKKSVASVLCAVNQWLYRQGQIQYLSGRGMVTTFSGLVLKSGSAHIFYVGDSRIALLRDGTLEPLTSDHRVRLSRDSEYLSRAIGIEPELEIDCRTISVRAGDIFVFTTDGVHEYITSSKIIQLVGESSENIDGAAKAIVSAAFENDSPDNLTCQIVRVDHPGREDEETYLRKLTELPFPPDLGPGMMFEGYRIESEVHASNRTQVYIARDEDTDERVIIKTPSVNFEDDPGYIEMFMREEWIGRRIQSPNVVRVIEPKGPRCFLYYVTEYVDGKMLRQWMDETPQPNLVEVRGLADQIASGLRAFHRKDMIHQDLKPDNIVIDKHGTAKIIDFGSTGVAGLDEIDSPVHLPKLVGTVNYTAPEYHLGYKPTNRSDIYSLGVIVYEMLTGELPYGQGFAGKSSVDKLKFTPPGEHNPSVPFWVSCALAKAVHRDPQQRYDALSALIADLARPNPEFDRPDAIPFLQRNPAVFWQWVALASLLANVMLLLAVASD